MHTFKSENISVNEKKSARKFFIPCVFAKSLLEAVPVTAKNAVRGDVILHSPAAQASNHLRDFQHRGEVFREVSFGLAATICRGHFETHPNRQATSAMAVGTTFERTKKIRFAPGFFEEKPRRESTETINHKTPPHMKGRLSAPKPL